MRLLRLAMLCFAILGLAVPAASAADFYVLGSMGDSGAADQCASGQYVVGFEVAAGAWFDRIAVVCGTIGSNFAWSTKTVLPARGGPGGGPESDTGTLCTTQEIVTGFLAYFTEDRRQVQGVTLNCSSAATGAVRAMSFWSPHQDTAQYHASEDCPSGEAAIGFNIRYGKAVNGLGLICGPYSAAAVTANAQPSKPIKTTGQPVGGSATSTVADNVLVCQGGGMAVTPVSGSSTSMFVSFVAAAQGAGQAQPAPGQCAWSSGPIGSVWNKLGVSTTQPMGPQLMQAAQNGGSFVVEARTLGNGIVYVSRIDGVQPASGSGTTAAANAATTPPAGSGYVLACQGGGDMNISGGGAVLGGSSFFIVSFKAAAQGAGAAPPDPGTCAWIDRALRPGEPLTLQIPNDLQGVGKLKQAIDGGTFQVHANTVGKDLLVNQVDDAVPAQGGTAATTDDNSGGGTSASGGGSVLQPPITGDNGGGQPMTIAKAVNVYTKAGGGSALGSLPAGTPVMSLGCKKSWCHVTFTGGDGYVAQSSLGH